MNLQQLQQHNNELAILNSIAQVLNQELDLEKALDRALQKSIELLQLKTGWIWLFNPASNTAYLAASHQLPPIFAERPELLSGTCYCIKKYLTDKLDNASNISEITCTRLENLQDGTSGLRYHASIPLSSQQEKLGILNVLSTDSQELSQSNLQLLYTIGDMLGIAIARARLFANSRQTGVIEERNRLAREIHDTLAQSLAAISLRLESMEILLEKEVPKARLQDQVQKTLSLTRNSLEEARRSVLDLRASPLEQGNLATAIELLIEDLRSPKNLKVDFEILGQYRLLAQRVEMALYRIAQEAINNIRQHARAKKVRVSLHYQNDSVVLQIEDNGIGFDFQKEQDGFGLISINERAKLIHSGINVQSSPGAGTQITVTVLETISNEG